MNPSPRRTLPLATSTLYGAVCGARTTLAEAEVTHVRFLPKAQSQGGSR
jgi:hypothetical protein